MTGGINRKIRCKMAEETTKKKLPRAVVVEFDFTAIDGAETLFGIASEQLLKYGIELTAKLEALHLANGNCQGAMRELFAKFGKKQDPVSASRELMDAFRAALTEKAVAAVTPDFKAFVNALSAKGLKIVIATRADLEVLKPALADFDANLVSAYSEPSQTYGNCKWDAWRRVLRANELHEMLTVAVTGSGYGVRSALVAGMPALAIVHDHVAYQDFGGADVVATGFSANLAGEVLRMLHLED